MKQTHLIMGMPITVEIVGAKDDHDMADVFAYFTAVDERFSTYKPESEISRINRGLPRYEWSNEMVAVLELCEQTRHDTNGYFDIIRADGLRDPSGLVKGWAIHNAASMLRKRGITNFYIEAGGDIEARGDSEQGDGWTVGIRNPFQTSEIVKVVRLHNAAIATSGTYIRGEHIYNPNDGHRPANTIRSLTVIGSNIYDVDRFATAACAMGSSGMLFIEALPGFEGYMIDAQQIATFTSGFGKFVVHA